MNNAATYVRVSSKEQLDNNSMSFQIRALRKYAAELGYIILKEFADPGVSARSIDRRNGLLDALEYALANLGPGDYFMVYDASRLCRQLSDAIRVFDDLRSAGITITTTNREYFHSSAGRRDWLRDSLEADYDSDVKSESTIQRMVEPGNDGCVRFKGSVWLQEPAEVRTGSWIEPGR